MLQKAETQVQNMAWSLKKNIKNLENTKFLLKKSPDKQGRLLHSVFFVGIWRCRPVEMRLSAPSLLKPLVAMDTAQAALSYMWNVQRFGPV